MSKGFLEESEGVYSAMRAMSFIALFAAMLFGFMVISGDGSAEFGTYIVFGFLIAAFAPKALQKFAENNLTANS
mgnify:FL=1